MCRPALGTCLTGPPCTCLQDFLNGVCTNIIHMHQKQLKYYAGEPHTLANPAVPKPGPAPCPAQAALASAAAARRGTASIAERGRGDELHTL